MKDKKRYQPPEIQLMFFLLELPLMESTTATTGGSGGNGEGSEGMPDF